MHIYYNKRNKNGQYYKDNLTLPDLNIILFTFTILPLDGQRLRTLLMSKL